MRSQLLCTIRLNSSCRFFLNLRVPTLEQQTEQSVNVLRLGVNARGRAQGSSGRRPGPRPRPRVFLGVRGIVLYVGIDQLGGSRIVRVLNNLTVVRMYIRIIPDRTDSPIRV